MIFDSDVLTWFFRGEPAAGRLIDSQLVRRLSIVSLMELFQGAESKREMSELRRFFRGNSFEVIPLDEPISYAAAGLIEDHALSDGLQVADALIAATALQSGDTLATVIIYLTDRAICRKIYSWTPFEPFNKQFSTSQITRTASGSWFGFAGLMAS